MARKPPSPSFDVPTIKSAAVNRWPEILSQLAGIPSDVLDGRHHPCPKCGGTDRFRFTNVDQGGSAICNQCLVSRNGDGLAVLQWLTGDDFPATLARVADYLGIKPAAAKRPKADPLEHITPQPWNDVLASLWCRSKPPITPAAVQAFNGKIARWSQYGGFSVIALPIWGQKLQQAPPVGVMMWNLSGGQMLPKRPKKKGDPIGWVKMRTTTGSRGGIIALGATPVDLQSVTIWKTEGPGDALALWSMIPEADRSAHFIFCNSSGAKECPPWIVAMFDGCTINIVHDADQPGQEGAAKWAIALTQLDASVRHVKLPYEIAESAGKDLRNYLQEHQFSDLLVLAGETDTTIAPTPAEVIANESDDDPHRLARLYLGRYGSSPDHGPTLKYWRQEWFPWCGEHYERVSAKELRPAVTAAVKEQFNLDHQADLLALSTQAEKEPTVRKVTQSLVANVVGALEGMTIIPSSTPQPCWLGDSTPIKLPIVALENGLLHLDRLITSQDDYTRPHSPEWFSTVCLPFKFDAEATCPTWHAFLERNLEMDPERIKLLQEWAGYLLTPSTDQQKFLILEGEGSNGKSVYLAAVEAMLGQANVSHVSLEVFGDRFSRTDTLGKLANIVAEVGEMDRIAEGYLKSFTSGDTMFFDRKGIAGLNVPPTARMMLGTNNLPRFADRSQGIWRRMILVPWRISIPENEQVLGMDKPVWWEKSGELPGIFNWALIGLHRLRKQRRFTKSELCQEALTTYKSESNPAGMFLSEACELTETGQIECKTLYQAYHKWVRENGYKPLGERAFGKEVKRKFPVITRKRIGMSTCRVWIYFGVDFSEISKQSFTS